MAKAARNAERFAEIGASGYVFAEDVIFLRREVFANGIVSNSELDALFAIGERAPKGDPEWPAFFEEAATDFYLRQQKPQGYFTPDQFESLRARVTRDGETASPLEFRVLMRLLETARETPPAMHSFIAGELRRAILDKGPDAAVTREETSLVRRFIFAGGGADNVAVTRDEAELIFDINDATMGLGNDQAWTEFFVVAISNHLMAHFTFDPPDRHEALRLESFAEDRTINPGGFLKKMLSLAGLKPEEAGSAQAQRNEARELRIVEAEKIAPEEADWLADRIGRDGVLGEGERRIVNHIRDLGAELPPKLKALVERAA
ncbi:MAG TPA: hypothetical protein VNH64_05285 [Parvularculaceae bacterium]|nr:hypothetical protein [Parvularculaceae bacterium]